MAVNRFSRFPQPARVQLPSFQELMFAPSQMRQQEDQLQENILQNSLLQANVTQNDQELARNFLDPIEEQFQNLSKELVKSGYSQDMKNKFINFKTNLAKTKRDIIQPLEQKQAAIQAEAERLRELYKDRPEDLRTNLNRFLSAQQGAQLDPQTGKLVGTGVNTNLFMGRTLDADELGGILKDTMTVLKQDMINSGIDPTKVQNINDFETLISFASSEGVGADRINRVIRNVGGPQLMNHFKQLGFNKGIMPETPQQLAAVKASVVDNINNSDRLTEEQKQQRIQEIDSIQTPEQYQNYVADQSLNEFSMSSAGAMAYQNVDIDRITSKDDLALFKAKKNMEDQLALSSIDFAFTNNKAPFFVQGLDEFELDEKTGQLVFPEYGGAQNISSNGTLPVGIVQEYKYIDTNTGEVVSDPFTALKSEGKLGTSYRVKEGYKAVRRDLYTKNALEDKVSNLKSKIPALRNVSDSDMLQRLKQFRDSATKRVTSGVFDPTKDDKRFMDTYFGSKNQNGVVELGKLATKSNYSLNNKTAGTDLNTIADELGYDGADDLITEGAISAPVFAPALGEWVVTALDSDGQEKNIYIEPDNQLASIVEPIKEAYQVHLSGEPFKKLSKMTSRMSSILGTQDNYYLYTDYESENPVSYIISADYLPDYDAAKSYINTIGVDRKDKVMQMEEYIDYFTNATLPNSVHYKKYFE